MKIKLVISIDNTNQHMLLEKQKRLKMLKKKSININCKLQFNEKNFIVNYTHTHT